MAYSVQDVPFDGPDCINVPVRVEYTKLGPSVDIDVFLVLRQAGSNRSVKGPFNVLLEDPVSGARTDSVLVCPSDYSAAGPFQVTGTITSYDANNSATDAALSGSLVDVIRNRSVLSGPKVKRKKNGYAVSGRATAVTLTKGRVGAAGRVTVRVRVKGSARWRKLGAVTPDAFGAWRVLPARIPADAKVRATLTGCTWCTDATASTRVRR